MQGVGSGKDSKAPSTPHGKLCSCESEIRKNQIIITYYLGNKEITQMLL